MNNEKRIVLNYFNNIYYKFEEWNVVLAVTRCCICLSITIIYENQIDCSLCDRLNSYIKYISKKKKSYINIYNFLNSFYTQLLLRAAHL